MKKTRYLPDVNDYDVGRLLSIQSINYSGLKPLTDETNLIEIADSGYGLEITEHTFEVKEVAGVKQWVKIN